MPEGDTLYRAATRMNEALAGSLITRFETVLPQLLRDDIAGRSVERVRSVGKHLLIEMSGGLALRTHLRMHGSWHLYRPGEKWLRGRGGMRIVIETERFVAVGFNVPVAEFVRTTAANFALQRLGPDLLSESFDADEAFRRLRERSKVEVADALLDQQALAGIGNVFKSEILFLAGRNPFDRVEQFDDAELRELIEISHRQLNANVADARTRTPHTRGLRQTTRRSNPSERTWVYGRHALPCRRCGTPIEYRKQGPNARGTYWCPRCQSPRVG